MTSFAYSTAPRSMVLCASTAAELMTSKPFSLEMHTSIPKVSALLQLHGLEAAPVVDESGRLLGVVTASACAAWEEFSLRSSPFGSPPNHLDSTPVSAIVNPLVETVLDTASVREVLQRLTKHRSQRIYVVNEIDELIGVISMSDVLRRLIDDREAWRYSQRAAWPMH